MVCPTKTHSSGRLTKLCLIQGFGVLKSREERNRVQRLWYQRNKEARLIQIKSRVSWIRKYVSEYKENNSVCLDCGVSYPPYVLDFDHLPQFEKSFPLSSSGVKGRGLDAVNEEIAKCEIVCANCHRHRTFMRKAKDRENSN